jgi:hypothetical protein
MGGTESDRRGRYRPDRRWSSADDCSWSDRSVDSSSVNPRWVISNTARASTRIRCRLGNLLQLLGAPVSHEDVQERAVMDAGQVEDAQLLADRPPAEFVGRPAAPFAALGEVLEKGGRVVAPEPLVGISGHGAPFWSSLWRYARLSSRSRLPGACIMVVSQQITSRRCRRYRWANSHPGLREMDAVGVAVLCPARHTRSQPVEPSPAPRRCSLPR